MLGILTNFWDICSLVMYWLGQISFDENFHNVDGSGSVVGVSFSGLDLLQYYFYIVKNFLSEFPWQVRTAYLIVLACIMTILSVLSLFLRRVVQRRNFKATAKHLGKKYNHLFYEILSNDTMSSYEIEDILGSRDPEFKKIETRYFVDILTRERMKLYELVYLPNLQSLADMTGVREFFEENLLKGRDVFQTLQTLCMFQFIISEGRLANYVNSSDKDIRMMARMCYILCGVNEPYRYLLDDLDSSQSMMRPMIMHYIFGWMKSQNRRMPNFLAISDRLRNDEMAGFMIKEVAYWGSEEEKHHIPDYYRSPRRQCRSAAIQVTGLLAMAEFEEQLIDSYAFQPEHLRRDIMRAVLAINSGKRIQFYIDAYSNTPSRHTRELCLNCLYSYGNEGRRAFEELRSKADAEERIMMEEIDSLNILVQIRALK